MTSQVKFYFCFLLRKLREVKLNDFSPVSLCLTTGLVLPAITTYLGLPASFRPLASPDRDTPTPTPLKIQGPSSVPSPYPHHLGILTHAPCPNQIGNFIGYVQTFSFWTSPHRDPLPNHFLVNKFQV